MSKFSGLRAARLLDIQKSGELKLQTSSLADASAPITMGRPRRENAKHRHPDYRQVTAYIRRDTYAEVRGRLFINEREFSDLVQELLSHWLKR